MQKVSKSLVVKICVIGVGILLMQASVTVAEEKSDGREYVNAKPAFSIRVPSWGEIEKQDIDFVALGVGVMKVPQIVVSKAEYYTDGSSAESLANSMIGLLKDRYSGTDFIITYTKEIKLADGTPAFEAGIKWNLPIASLDSCCVWVKKGDTRIAAVISDMIEIKDSLKYYLYTLSIK